MEPQTPSAAGRTPLGPSESAAARAALDRILASPGFGSGTRRSQLLKYLVEQWLNGESDHITEYGLGLDVFGRPASFDPRIDSIVRTEVSRLRVKLREYYQDAGRGDPVVIEIPQRSYAPAMSIRREERVGETSAPAGILAADPNGGYKGYAADAPAPAASVPVMFEAERGRKGPVRSVWRAAALWTVAGIASVGAIVLAISARGHSSPPVTSVVVLPFQDYSPGRDAEYLADGVTEELTNQLAQDRDLRVVARTSASVFKNKGVDVREIGKRLNVGAALEGSLAKDGDSLRVTAQLNRTSDGYHLWSRSYVAEFSDLGKVQAEIGSAVESAVTGRGAPKEEAAPDPEAHDYFLQGSFQLARQTPESLDRSLELFQKAADKDPGYVDAWRGIARAEISRIHYTVEAPRPAFERARRALERALDIRPGDPETLGQLADIDYVYYWDWPRAEKEFQQAVQGGARAPTYSYYGWALATRGRFDEARKQFELAQDLDPLGAGPRFNRALALLLERRFGEARRIFQESIEAGISPLDAHLMLGVTAVYEHNCAEAGTQFDWFAKHLQAPVADFGLALGAACAGNRTQAADYIARAESGGGKGFVSPYQLAMAQASVGNADAAFGDLEKSADAREGQIFYIKYDPIFDGIRKDPRMDALCKRIGLE